MQAKNILSAEEHKLIYLPSGVIVDPGERIMGECMMSAPLSL